jgi:hypothetical protein
MLSAFSMYCHLAGKLKEALVLEQSAYELSKAKQTIFTALSLKHL